MQRTPVVSSVRGFGQVIRAILLGGVLAAAVIAMSAPVALAQGAQTGPRSREDLVAKITGKKIRMDKATGAVRAITAEEARELIDSIVAATDRAGAGLEPVVGPNGVQMIDIEGHFGHVVISRYNPDGSISLRCVATADEAAEFLAEEPLDIR